MVLIDYIRFLVKSVHLHGVHSPFVFSLVTKGLRSKEKMPDWLKKIKTESGFSQKQGEMLLKIMRYLGAKNVFVDDENLQKLLQVSEENISVENQFFPNSKQRKYDLIFFKNISKEENFLSFLEYIHNDSILIVNDIHLKQNKKYWKELIRHNQTTVCIDTFTQGYVFIRKEQKKELFFIKV